MQPTIYHIVVRGEKSEEDLKRAVLEIRERNANRGEMIWIEKHIPRELNEQQPEK